MTKQEKAARELMRLRCAASLAKAWQRFGNIYGARRIGPMPEIKMSGRLKRTAGQAWLDRGLIEISVLLFSEFEKEFHSNTIPHECAHFVAFRVFGEENHGKPWKQVMVDYGIEPHIYHDYCARLETRRQIRSMLKD